MGQWVGAQGQVKVAKKCKYIPTCEVPPANAKPKTKIFFSMSTRRLAEFLEGLNSSLGLAAGFMAKKGRANILARAVVKGF